MSKLIPIACFIVLLVAIPTLQAKNSSKSVKKVHCPSDSLADAITKVNKSKKSKKKKSAQVIEFDGTCNEDIAVDSGNLTIRGLDASAIVRGSVTISSTGPGATGATVLLQNFAIDESPGSGLSIGVNGTVFAENLQISDSLRNGIEMSAGSFLRCELCNVIDNGEYGLLAVSNATVEIVGTVGPNIFSSNGISGVGIASSAQITVGYEPGVSLVANGNRDHGMVISDGGSIFSTVGSTIETSNNGAGPVFGAGVLVGTGSSGLLNGDTIANGNDAGVWSVAGKLLIFGDVTANNNTFGLFVRHNGTLRLTGSSNILEDNVRGVQVDGSYLQLDNATYNGNIAQDVFMRFGAKGQFTNSAPATVFCDDPARILIRSSTGNVACP